MMDAKSAYQWLHGDRLEYSGCRAAAEAMQAELDRLRAENEALREALALYADPSFYHGCGFAFDRPTGGFDSDFEYDEEYGRTMPGKAARAALAPNAPFSGERSESAGTGS